MITFNKYNTLNALLVILAIVSGYYWYQPNARSAKPAATASIDSFALGVHALQYNAEGLKRGEMTTPKLIHFTANDSALLTTPQFTLYPVGNTAPWLISANEGQTFNGSKQIDLRDHVVIHQPRTANNSDSTIETSLLHIFPKENFANTDQRVTLVQPGINVSSIGMNAYLNEKRVTLLSHARSSYDPHKAQPITALS